MEDDHLPICTACGSQFDSEDGAPPERCKICDVNILLFVYLCFIRMLPTYSYP